ncbi:hypothetical protein [Streptococcus cuniculi]|uniref:Uncharacterized protein n=1 Tax=Streptococcus cuniculi TaxID=1432788 RepID=A0A4Y9JF92_9STRE|nr:hypothetical protein [Streptococcus cuniculi]MBF0777449.1 hypothetical protein [Streptococcus cuniculi]TFU98505.1 hypothetical protein E4T82_01685 [Streptococcus cuniculi]
MIEDYAENNPFINAGMLYQRHVEYMKTQERIAIQAMIAAAELGVSQEKISLALTLQAQKTQLEQLASQTIVGELQEGLTGKTADAAKEYLKKELFKPRLKNPVK